MKISFVAPHMSDKANSHHVSNPAEENEEENNTNPSAAFSSHTVIFSGQGVVLVADTTIINNKDKNSLYICNLIHF